MMKYDSLFWKTYPTGSHYICNPPVTNTDIDFVCLQHPDVDRKKTHLQLYKKGFTKCKGQGKHKYTGNEGLFTSYRKGNLNLIVVYSMEQFKAWRKATDEAKKLNLTNKEDRVKLFEKHRAGVSSLYTVPRENDLTGLGNYYYRYSDDKKSWLEHYVELEDRIAKANVFR